MTQLVSGMLGFKPRPVFPEFKSSCSFCPLSPYWVIQSQLQACPLLTVHPAFLGFRHCTQPDLQAQVAVAVTWIRNPGWAMSQGEVQGPRFLAHRPQIKDEECRQRGLDVAEAPGLDFPGPLLQEQGLFSHWERVKMVLSSTCKDSTSKSQRLASKPLSGAPTAHLVVSL